MMVSKDNYSNISLFQVHHNLPSSHAITMFRSFCQSWIEMCYIYINHPKFFVKYYKSGFTYVYLLFTYCLPIVYLLFTRDSQQRPRRKSQVVVISPWWIADPCDESLRLGIHQAKSHRLASGLLKADIWSKMMSGCGGWKGKSDGFFRSRAVAWDGIELIMGLSQNGEFPTKIMVDHQCSSFKWFKW